MQNFTTKKLVSELRFFALRQFNPLTKESSYIYSIADEINKKIDLLQKENAELKQALINETKFTMSLSSNIDELEDKVSRRNLLASDLRKEIDNLKNGKIPVSDLAIILIKNMLKQEPETNIEYLCKYIKGINSTFKTNKNK